MSYNKPNDLSSIINKVANPNAFGAGSLPFIPQSGRFATPDGFTNLFVTQFVVLEEMDDYLVCSTMKVGSEREISVAKPFIFLPSWYDGRSLNGVSYVKSDIHTRVATLDSDTTVTETQTITPDYLAGEILTVLNVRVHEYQEDWLLAKIKLKDEAGHNIKFIDMNLAGRCWAATI